MERKRYSPENLILCYTSTVWEKLSAESRIDVFLVTDHQSQQLKALVLLNDGTQRTINLNCKVTDILIYHSPFSQHFPVEQIVKGHDCFEFSKN